VNFDTGHTEDHPGVVSHRELVTLKASGHLTFVDKSRPWLQREVRIVNRGDKVCRIDYRIVRRGAERIAGGLPNDKPRLASLLRVMQVRQCLILTRLSRRRVREVGATTTVGTTLSDYCTRSLGIGYTGGSTILLICVIASLLIWRWSTGSISIETVSTPKVEIFYWVTIMFSQTLGTALGDWVADTNEMGYLGAAAVFGGLLLLTALLYYVTSFSRVILFWAAFILTRPLGATLGDFLDKPIAQGGLALSRYTASLALLMVIVALILIFPQKPAPKAH
jgi:hypothetical protein